jgi:hypothetical protein
MGTHSNTLSALWLKPIIGLIRDGDFGEAYALAEYFPSTIGRKLVQCLALIDQDRLEEADSLLKTLSNKMQTLSSDFAFILSENNIDLDLIRLALNAMRSWRKYFYVSNLCLESQLIRHPEAIQTVIDGLISVISESVQPH